MKPLKNRLAPFALLGLSLVPLTNTLAQEDAAKPETVKAPFAYLPAKAYHILPGTHNNESGYFSLVEGKNGKIYIGTAKYGENSFLVEFDPKTEKQRAVIDTNKVSGATGKGYAAQSKIHTKNFVGASGTVYVGSKEGYASQDEKAANNIAPYPGGYVMTYNPKTGAAKSLGMPWPGQGVGDVVADEARNALYVVTCEDEYWMKSDLAGKNFRWLGPQMFEYASTLIDARGRANSITTDYRLARYDPTNNKLTIQDVMVDGKKLDAPEYKDRTGWIPSWAMTPDGKTAYLMRMSHPELYKLDLSGEMDKPMEATMVGRMLNRDETDCRSGVSIGPDGKVYVAIARRNDTGYGAGYQLNHLTRYDPTAKKVDDLGVMVVENKGFFDFSPGADGQPKPFANGYQTLPDGTLTAQYQHLGSITASDGTVYVLILSPYTLLRISPAKIAQAATR